MTGHVVVEHPVWCDKARCTATLDTTAGEHRSVPVAVPAGPPELRVHVGLVQGTHADSPAAVELYISGRYQGYLLSRNARTLGRILADLGRAGLR